MPANFGLESFTNRLCELKRKGGSGRMTLTEVVNYFGCSADDVVDNINVWVNNNSFENQEDVVLKMDFERYNICGQGFVIPVFWVEY